MADLVSTPYSMRGGRDHTRLPLSHSHPHSLCPLPPQPIRTTQEHLRSSKPAASFYTSKRPYPPNLAIYRSNSMDEAQAFFKDFVDNPDHVYLPSHFSAQQTPAMQQLPINFSFRPLGGYQQLYTATPPQVPPKVEDTTALPIPALLPGSVDASQYESIAYSDWLQASTEYESLSPSTLQSQADSPATPGDWEPDHTLARSAFSSMQADGSACNHFWIAQAQNLPAQVQRGLPLTERDNVINHSGQQCQTSLHINAAAIRDLSFAASSSCNDDGIETAAPASSHGDGSEAGDAEDVARRQQDDLLLRMREEGYKYGEIKRRGRFKEAESTLRGRYRSLTKGKLQRLRNPQWQQHDIVLLRQAVKRYTNSNMSQLETKHGGKKVPWKKIGEWIKHHGGSYLFAPATCAKKWESLKRLSPASPSASSDKRSDKGFEAVW